MDAYLERPGQLEMARAVAEVLHSGDRQALFCEAATGIGKSLAYLVPVLLSGQRHIISTGTLHLQNQLYSKDLALLSRILPAPKTVLLKGRSNYLCWHRLRKTLRGDEINDPRQLRQLRLVEDWSRQTVDGDLSSLPEVAEESPLRPRLTSTRENCLGTKCEDYDRCFVYRIRSLARDADLIISNHSMVLADMVLGRDTETGGILPRVDGLIFDEAHLLPEMATRQFGDRLSSHAFEELIHDVSQAYREEAGEFGGIMELLSDCGNVVVALRNVLHQAEPDTSRMSWSGLCERSSVVADLMNRFLQQQQRLSDALALLAERGEQLEQCACRSHQMLLFMRCFLGSDDAGGQRESDAEAICWLEADSRKFVLHRSPLDVSRYFRAGLDQYDAHCVFCSATLAMGTDISFFTSQLGCPKARYVHFDSPFELRCQALLYLPEHLPDPRSVGFQPAFAGLSRKLLSYSRGRAFILCTSHRVLRETARLLGEGLEYPLLVQGQASRQELLRRFRNQPNAVLLGTSSFWSGVDVRGPALSLVIIEKLPFASNSDPVLAARCESMERSGQSAFMNYQLPQAIVILKQGVGRLIRSVEDTGVCVICDRRILEKGYGRYFRAALSDWPETRSLDAVQAFFARNG